MARLDLMEQSGKAEPKAISFVIGYMVVVAAIAVLTRDIQLL